MVAMMLVKLQFASAHMSRFNHHHGDGNGSMMIVVIVKIKENKNNTKKIDPIRYACQDIDLDIYCHILPATVCYIYSTTYYDILSDIYSNIYLAHMLTFCREDTLTFYVTYIGAFCLAYALLY